MEGLVAWLPHASCLVRLDQRKGLDAKASPRERALQNLPASGAACVSIAPHVASGYARFAILGRSRMQFWYLSEARVDSKTVHSK